MSMYFVLTMFGKFIIIMLAIKIWVSVGKTK